MNEALARRTAYFSAKADALFELELYLVVLCEGAVHRPSWPRHVRILLHAPGTAAEALREYGELALWIVPVHGVFAPNLEPVSTLIERVAKQHLEFGAARREPRDALRVVEWFEPREPIESAVNHVEVCSDEAYFYAGVAFGVTLADFR
jgi:hypothetical protein